MELKDKITSKEDLIKVIGASKYQYSFDAVAKTFLGMTDNSFNVRLHWWAVREYSRLNGGVYDTTEALEAVNKHVPYLFAHISGEDPAMVAYTPDARFGAEDRQLRITLGKFLARVMPLASDDYIRDLAAWHTAELSNEVEWIEGSDISETYKSDTSTGACMSNKSNYTVQPTESYDAAGIKMAVLRKVSSGALSARAMVFESGSKKVYIRAYGSPVLKKRLERLGYKPGTWEGAQFKTIFLDGENRKISTLERANLYAEKSGGVYKVVTPYLDASGGTCNTNSCSLALIDMKLTCLTADMRATLAKIGYKSQVPSTMGYVQLNNLDASDYKVVDLLTGEEFDRLTCESVLAVVKAEDGTLKTGYVNVNAGFGAIEGFVAAKLSIDNVYTQVYCDDTLTFAHRYDNYVKDEATYKALGYRKLDATLYPDEQEYTVDYATLKSNGAVQHIKVSDAVQIVRASGSVDMCHKSAVTKKMVQLRTSGNYKGYADEGVEVMRTPSGAKVHIRYNEGLVPTFNGIDYKRNVKNVGNILGSAIYASKGTFVSDSPEYSKYCEEVYRERVDMYLSEAEGNYMRALTNIATNDYYAIIYAKDGNKHLRNSVYIRDALRRADCVEYKLEVLEAIMRSSINKYTKKFAKEAYDMFVEASAVEPQAVPQSTPTVESTHSATSEERFALAA